MAPRRKKKKKRKSKNRIVALKWKGEESDSDVSLLDCDGDDVGNAKSKTKREIEEYKAYYESTENLIRYFKDELGVEEDTFLATLASIGLAKDDMAKFGELHGVKFRWVAKVDSQELPELATLPSKEEEDEEDEDQEDEDEEDTEKEGVDPIASVHTGHAGAACASPVAASAAGSTGEANEKKTVYLPELPKNMKYVLQLKSKATKHSKGVWKDWVSLRNSSFRNGGIGLYSEREFKKHAPLGFYVGPTIWRSDVEGGSKPSDGYLKKRGIREPDDELAKYDLAYLDNDCFYRLVRPKPLTYGGPGLPLYMGFHYANSYTETFVRKATRREKKKGNNIVFKEDGMVLASKKIPKDTELLVGYQEDEANVPQDRKPCDRKRKIED